jgi:hypothetical protein
MAMQLFGRPDILPDIPEEVVGAGDFIQPGSNPHGFSGYPTWDRRRSVEERANQIMMENPGIASPEAAVEMAEREIPQYSPSERRIVAMEDYYRNQGHPSPQEAAIMEEEDAWRQRGRLIRDSNASGRAAPARATTVRPAPESRTEGASLPLPADGEVSFGSTAGMPPVEDGVDPKRVAEVAAPMVAAGIPREEAWQRAQVQLMRGTAPQPPRPAADPWAGYETFEGADRDKVAALADHFVRTRGMNSDQAWDAAQVEASRDTIRGGTIPYAEADSRLRGGAGIVRDPNMTVPGRNDETGTPTSVSRKMSDKEAYDYNYRAPAGAEGGVATQGGYELSQRDKDMMKRGLVPVQTPNGVRYMPMAGYSRNEAGRPGVPGYREDLVERGYEGQKVKDVQGMDATVYVRTPEGAARAERTRLVPLGGMQGGSPTAHNQRIKDLAERAGVSIEEARKIVDQTVADSLADNKYKTNDNGEEVLDDNGQRILVSGGDNDIVMGSNAAYQRLRDMGTSRYQADKLERVKESRRQAMLAGGQPTSGPNGTRARDAAIGMLPPDWQAQVLANRASGGQIAGATPFDVESSHNQQLSALGLRVATGRGFQESSEAAQARATLDIAEARRKEEQMIGWRKTAAAAWRGWNVALGSSREGEVRRALQAQGVPPEVINQIIDELSEGGGEDTGEAPPGAGGRPAGVPRPPSVQVESTQLY